MGRGCVPEEWAVPPIKLITSSDISTESLLLRCPRRYETFHSKFWPDVTRARAAEAERERRCLRNVPAQSQTGTSEQDARGGETAARGKRSRWDEKVEMKQEILTRTNKNGCSVKKRGGETWREIGAREGGAWRF